MTENPLTLSRGQFSILFHRILHLLGGELLLFAKRLGVDVGFRNAMCYQEALCAFDSPFSSVAIIPVDESAFSPCA